MNQPLTILSITASDTIGGSGLQADVRTITEMGAHALSAVTAVSVEGRLGVMHLHDLPQSLVLEQVQSALLLQPQVVKVGMLRDAATIAALGNLFAALGQKPMIVLSPGILASDGRRLADASALEAFRSHLLPITTLLVVRCSEAELILGTPIRTDDEMLAAARRLRSLGAQWIMLRGGLQTEGRCTALLYGDDVCRYFASYNIEGWRQHGVGGALAAAMATRLAFADDVPAAVSKAHDYVHSKVVYAVRPDSRHLRPSDLYNQLLSLVAQYYGTAHDVAFYADKLSISTRYLSQLTNKYVGKSPKMVIADYLIAEAKLLLETSRLTIQEISFRLGFPNQASFSKFFSQHVGKSPSQWR